MNKIYLKINRIFIENNKIINLRIIKINNQRKMENKIKKTI